MSITHPCYTDFKKATTDLFDTNDEKESVFKELEKRAKYYQRKRYSKRAQAYNMPIDELLEDLEKAEKDRKRAALINIKIRNTAIGQVEKYPKQQRMRGTYGYFGGIESNVTGSRDSVVAAIRSYKGKYNAYFYGKMRTLGVFKLFKQKEYGVEIAKSLYGEKVENEKIKVLTDIVENIYDSMINKANSLGASIVKAEDRAARTIHHVDKMKSATGSGIRDFSLRGKLLIELKDPAKVYEVMREKAYQRWKKIIIPLTNMQKTFKYLRPSASLKVGEEIVSAITNEDIDGFFRSFYDAVTTGERDKPFRTGGHPAATRSGSNFAKRLNASRVWFAKDGTSWAEYNTHYGYGTVQDAIVGQISKMSSDIGIMEKMGTNPEAFSETFIRKMALDNRLDPKKNKWVRKSKAIVRTILGEHDRPIDGMAGKIFQFYQMKQYATKLGNVTLSSIGDVNLLATALRPYGISWLKSSELAIKAFIKGAPKGEAERLAISLGVFSDGSLGGALSRFGNVNGRDSMFGKLIQLNEHLTGIGRLDVTGRSAMGFALSEHLAHNLENTFENLNKGTRTNLLKYNIDSKIWNLFRKHRNFLTSVDGKKFLTPDIIHDLSDESIARIYYGNKTGKTTRFKLKKARTDIHDRLYTFFVDQSDYAKPVPNAGDRAILSLGASPNSYAGMIMRALTVFKSFPVSAFRRTWVRFIYENGADNLFDALVHGKADYNGMAKYVLGGLPYEYISLAMKAIAQGKEPPSLEDKKTWMKMFGGVTFAYGSILMANYERNTGAVQEASGPVIMDMSSTISLISNLIHGKDVKMKALNMLEHNMPAPVSTAFFKLAFDHILFNNLREKIKPGYKYKMREKARKAGQQYLWLP